MLTFMSSVTEHLDKIRARMEWLLSPEGWPPAGPWPLAWPPAARRWETNWILTARSSWLTLRSPNTWWIYISHKLFCFLVPHSMLYFCRFYQNRLNKISTKLGLMRLTVLTAVSLSSHTAKRKPAAAEAGPAVTSCSQERLWDRSSWKRWERARRNGDGDGIHRGRSRRGGTQTG